MDCNNSSGIEPKRPHQWFMDSVEAELFPNKKQAIESPNPNSFSSFLNTNVSPWGNATSFHSVGNQFTERIVNLEIARTINLGDRNVPSVGDGNMNMETKVIEDSIGSDFSFGLSMSHSFEDPRLDLNYGGIRKVKVNQVKDTENCIPVSVGHTFDGEDNSTVPAPLAFGKTDDNSVSVGLSFNGRDNNMVPVGHTFIREDNNIISLGKLHNKNDNDETVIGPVYKQNGGSASLSESLNKDQCNIARLAETFKSMDGNTLSVSNSINMNGTIASIGLPFSMDDSNFIPVGQNFNKGAEFTASTDFSYHKVDDNSMRMSNSYNKIDDNNLSMGHSFTKGDSKIISFGGFGDDDDLNASDRLMCSYNLLIGQPSVQKSDPVNLKASVESNSDVAKASQITFTSEKKKADHKVNKKPPPNNFPSNVRSLLSTGILDGIPVKYIAWSREKELRGTIKGSAYLCSCQSCNYSKAINAYEFERHAGCKTKHPNNHIYFENGKTIYGIVQELRNTPQNLLFEVIQTITGSPINQKSFRLWKESFLAATRELQRIYGKDEG